MTFADALQDASAQAWPPFALVAGLLAVGAVADAEGLFARAARTLARPGASPVAVLAGLLALDALVTAVLNLDTAAAFLMPLMLYAARGLGAHEGPFLYGSVLMANAGSLFLPGSNLTNLLVLGGEGAPGSTFFAHMLPAALIAVAVTGAALHAPAHPRALLIGLDLGPNLAVTGALSALIWWRAARRLGARPSALRYSLVGGPTAVLAMALATLSLPG